MRLGIGMIFQQFNLFRSRTVWGNIAYPLEVAGVPKAEQNARISDLLHFVGLADKAHSHVEELSGGQKQRVGIARALATNPQLLLADESTSALDPETTREVLALLRRVNRELGITIVVITHEMDVVRSLAHRVVVMEAGRIVEEGPVVRVLSDPAAAGHAAGSSRRSSTTSPTSRRSPPSTPGTPGGSSSSPSAATTCARATCSRCSSSTACASSSSSAASRRSRARPSATSPSPSTGSGSRGRRRRRRRALVPAKELPR